MKRQYHRDVRITRNIFGRFVPELEQSVRQWWPQAVLTEAQRQIAMVYLTQTDWVYQQEAVERALGKKMSRQSCCQWIYSLARELFMNLYFNTAFWPLWQNHVAHDEMNRRYEWYTRKTDKNVYPRAPIGVSGDQGWRRSPAPATLSHQASNTTGRWLLVPSADARPADSTPRNSLPLPTDPPGEVYEGAG